jgi:hypothetical protein
MHARTLLACLLTVHAGVFPQVTYSVDTFLDKNKDALSNDLKEMLQSSHDSFIKTLFPPDVVQSIKRPPTAGLQFRVSYACLSCACRAMSCLTLAARTSFRTR